MPDPTSNDTVDPRVAATMAYLVGFLTGALILWRYRESDYVAFHAWQSILSSAFVAVVIVGVVTVPIAGPPLAIFCMIAATVAWVVLIVQAYRGRWTMLPLIGDIAFERSRRDEREKSGGRR